MILNLFLVSIFGKPTHFASIDYTLDYWSDDFDSDKNCEYLDKMKMLEKKEPLRCGSTTQGDDLIQWEECKKILAQNVMKLCPLMFEKVLLSILHRATTCRSQ